MGSSRSFAELGSKYARLAADYADLPKAQISEASLIVKKSVQAFMPGRLRGVGKNGARLNVRYNEGVYADGAKSIIFVTGPAQLIERDTIEHRIPKVRGARARTRHAVLPQAVPRSSGKGESRVFASVSHPGTKGKHPWAKGVEAALPIVNRLFETKADLALRRIF